MLSKWGADPCILLQVYASLIRSCLDFGSHIYTFQNHNYFEEIRNQALRLALCFRNSTPINGMLAEI